MTAVLLVSGLIGPIRVAATGGTGGPYDTGATELERILNIERVQAGLTALPIDTFLAAKARDGAVACLADPSLVMEGRAKDLAVNGWVGPSPHYLRLCPTESITDAMNAWGYTGWRGEIIAWNAGTNYADPGWYPSDCGVPGYPACEFLTYYTVSVAAIDRTYSWIAITNTSVSTTAPAGKGGGRALSPLSQDSIRRAA